MSTVQERIAYDFGKVGHDLSLVEVNRLAGLAVRTRIKRNFYPEQSHAVVEVMAEDLTWTNLLTLSPAGWHSSTTNQDSMNMLAGSLLLSGLKILGLIGPGKDNTVAFPGSQTAD